MYSFELTSGYCEGHVIHILFHTHETIQWALAPFGQVHRYPERDTNAESQSGLEVVVGDIHVSCNDLNDQDR